MFYVEYFNRTVVISAYNIRKINFLSIEKLRKLVIQAMKQPCKRVVLNLIGVRMIDAVSFEALKLLVGIAGKIGIVLMFMNVDEELRAQIIQRDKEKQFRICSARETKDFALP